MGRRENIKIDRYHNYSEKMSGFAKLFGGGKNKQPTPQEAIQKLRETEDMLTKKADFLEKRIEQELASAKKHGTKNKRAALNALKRKKRLEKQQEQIGIRYTDNDRVSARSVRECAVEHSDHSEHGLCGKGTQK